MNFPLRTKQKNDSKWKYISMAVLFCILSFLLFAFPKGTRSFFYYVSKPIWTGRDSFINSIQNVGNYFVSKNSLAKENMSLQDEVASLRLKELDYDILQRENAELKNMAGMTTNQNRILSRVLSKPPTSPYDTLVINSGSAEGLVKGNKVYLSGNIIIGVVTDITPHTSLVTLFSSGEETQSSVLERTGTSYDLSGRGGANFSLEAPKDADILWGDVFVYPGSTSSVIGSVYYIDSNSQSSFKTVYIRTPGNVFSTKWVYVEKTI
ncbi:MAG: rod shape-determining protein MreC [bacterium]